MLNSSVVTVLVKSEEKASNTIPKRDQEFKVNITIRLVGLHSMCLKL